MVTRRHWLIVASRDHARRGVRGAEQGGVA
jgi:hypothetical protein